MATALHTKKAFADALKQLMETRRLEDVSVGELSDACGMSRNTFYYHFQDKYDLVNWVFRTETEGFLRQGATRENWEELVHGISDYIRANKAFYRSTLAYNGQNSLQAYLFETLREIMIQRIRSIGKPAYTNLSEKEVGFAADFFAVGITGLLVRWAGHDFADDPADYHTSLQRVLSGRLLEDYLGQHPTIHG